PLDSNPTVGRITYAGPVGDWIVVVTLGLGEPVAGTPTTPQSDLATSEDSAGPANLIVQLSDTNFVPFPNETYVASVTTTTAGTLTYNVYRDTGNVLFGSTQNYAGGASATATQLFSEGPLTGTTQSSNAVTVANGGTAPYSLTLETLVTHNGPGETDSDAFLTALPPPPCNCTLNFNSPAAITNCAGDAIPDVTATDSCSTAPITATVTGAVTNGTNPQIITRTNIATDGCGNVHTFVQTITVNPLPDCDITTSVTTAEVGGSNYTASVVAVPGQTYVWTVMNGTLTAGQGTAEITWAAGADTNSPVTIVVTVTSSAGCSSTCSASVNLTPKPPEISLGHGDTATIGFWHNKNGQGLILNAANPPALANWLASNSPCMYGSLAGKPNSAVASLFLTDFGVKGQKTYAQVLAGALAAYFTSTDLGGGSGPASFGFNQSPGGTGTHLFNVGSEGTAIGLQNNTAYTVFQLLQAANANCPFTANSAVGNALNTIFNGINQGGDIN